MSKEREAFETWVIENLAEDRSMSWEDWCWKAWQAAKAQAVLDQLDVNSILHDIDCYFDNGLSNTERTANNLLQSIYEKLSGEVKAQHPSSTSDCPDEP